MSETPRFTTPNPETEDTATAENAVRESSVVSNEGSTKGDMQTETVNEDNEATDDKKEKRVNYRVLNGYYNSVTKKEISGEDLRAKYIRLTDKLIYEIETVNPDYIVYLDKSARPLSWMVSEFWDEFTEKSPLDPEDPESEPVTPEKPQTKFLNIDREEWREEVGSIDTGTINVSRVPQEHIEELRAIFLKGPRDESRSAMDQESLFDGKTVLVVDEVRSTGDTLIIAQQLLARAFPGARVEGRWWMTPPVVEGKSSELPVWYKENTPLGREVGNRALGRHALSGNVNHSSRQAEGYRFLSTRPAEVDMTARQLRNEIKQLHKDVKDGNQKFRRAIERS